ncbi:hypothetical protein Bhyg_15370 [Pseudolycoriella hygida]|uniref:Uncharacterized protein n=1 Tax=Pseudolycoriella hygida TaxID=35572 RepID=A0A9Q0RWI7_9DIPT|nr:hypothetical protein Bhyg_15370 [Pseudolycoriella hygida]
MATRSIHEVFVHVSRNALPIQYVEKRFEKPFDMVDNPIIVELEEATVEISPEVMKRLVKRSNVQVERCVCGHVMYL